MSIEDSNIYIENPSPPLEVLPEDELQIREASSILSNMNEIKQVNWETIGTEEKLMALQNVEDTMADVQGRPPVEIVEGDLGQNIFGFFDGNKITINSDHLRENRLMASEYLDTIIHEGRHAYQFYAVAHPGFVDNQELVQNWNENFKPGNYLSAEEYGQEIYASQPVEADAWNYAERIISNLESR